MVLMSPFIPETTQKLANVYSLDLTGTFEQLISTSLKGKWLEKLEPLFPRTT
jgi:methionyl-tRNA synthetase